MGGKWEAKITRGHKEIRLKVVFIIMAMVRTPQCIYMFVKLTKSSVLTTGNVLGSTCTRIKVFKAMCSTLGRDSCSLPP